MSNLEIVKCLSDVVRKLDGLIIDIGARDVHRADEDESIDIWAEELFEDVGEGTISVGDQLNELYDANAELAERLVDVMQENDRLRQNIADINNRFADLVDRLERKSKVVR